MKKLIYIFTILLFNSCNLLDVEPENSVTYTNYFKSELELESVTAQMHSFIRMYLLDNDHLLHEYAGAFADEVDPYLDDIRKFNPSSFRFDDPSCDWRNMYDIIYVANVMLDNLHRAVNVAPDRVDFHRGQACFGKGVAYFFITLRWGDAVITKDSKTMTAYGCSPALEVIDTVISNALEAYRLLPKFEDMKDRNGSPITTKQYGCKGSAAALLVHAYAWKGSLIGLYKFQGDSKACYEEAIAWAGKIIGGEAGVYAMQSPEELCQVMSKVREFNPESIFEIELDEVSSGYIQSNEFGQHYISWPVNIKASSGAIATMPLRILNETVDKMYDDNDLRKKAFFYTPKPEDNVEQTTYAYPYKWREGFYRSADNGEKEWQTLRANAMVWRLADIYLLRAECYAKIGNEPGAKSDLNEVRNRAHAVPYPSSEDRDIQYAVFKEREKELIFEGRHYYDIIRNGEEYIMKELPAGQANLINYNAIREGILYLPISSGAFTLNEKIRQNIYWSRYQ
ncbi:RagB/SusD family nutrient uptake outer membrane protein [uncultured Sanguibacteroides sp.]|uniref:RagB/SusD family nutrient uptake outer membrane protein n=1 Tax=uncultured Sanguibacteroides sp. TaxID=1635151 RepID=UPI0025E1E847|nr:RagB/SusD family nutrient uptake outer membrane protein [uncultured Sanguibacteroides sp.]